MIDLTGPEYYAELAERLDRHIAMSVIGVTAKREIGYAVEVLRQLAEGGSNA